MRLIAGGRALDDGVDAVLQAMRDTRISSTSGTESRRIRRLTTSRGWWRGYAAKPAADASDAWVKSLHVISIVAWMAALLYLPRLLVYHAGAAVDSEQSETSR
jgi:hypothetical protein